ncbi:MAG: octanoyltransferase [Gemmatimonadetes bacterium]|nr:octanoyltransferase [Gemmatimonadota bacterium]
MSMDPAPLRWRLVEEQPRTGARNMAVDHAMAELLGPGEAALRLYRWWPHTVSFGRNEPSRGRYDVAAAEREGLAFVRRPTGGRAGLHADEATYCAVLPVDAFGGVREAYLRINEGLVRGLNALGCPAEVAREGRALPPDAGPCFQTPAPGEVVLAGRKLVGSAQVRLGDAVLQHGSVILSGDQAALARLCGRDGDPFPPATLESVTGTKPWREVAEALGSGLALALGGTWHEGEVTPEEQAGAGRLERERYATDAWTWRR